jgi:hypothetical protein
MIKKIFNKLLEKQGKEYKIDIQIPNKLLVEMLFDRFVMRVRGNLIFKKKSFSRKWMYHKE